MRGGIPITARLLAMIGVAVAAKSGRHAPEVVSATRRYTALRQQKVTGSGTEQRKRRKTKRSVRSHGGRR